MRKLTAIIVDDELLARRLMKMSLEKIPEIEVVNECKNGREALKSIQELAPDLVFLDIQMPGLSGFDVIKAIQSDVMPFVIFCTAYDQYAIDAFDLHAVDYLLKPFEQERLERAVQRALVRVEVDAEKLEQKAPLIGAIDDIAQKLVEGVVAEPDLALQQETDFGKKLTIKDGEGITFVNVDDVDWVDAAGDYMCVHAKGTTHIMRSTMKELMGKLDPRVFSRIHRSTIVNLERVVKVKHHAKGEYLIDIDCGERLKVSRNYRVSIKSFLQK